MLPPYSTVQSKQHHCIFLSSKTVINLPCVSERTRIEPPRLVGLRFCAQLTTAAEYLPALLDHMRIHRIQPYAPKKSAREKTS
jgi:hypothetical protein